MFYCKECAEKNKWPETLALSIGPCEVCGVTRICNELPSRLLPPHV